MFTRFSASARQVVAGAIAEAQRRGDRRVSTEHLLLAVIADPTSDAHQALGVQLADARAALDAMDRAAMASVGVVVNEMPPSPSGQLRSALPFTAASKGVMRGCLQAALLDHSRSIESRHLLLALLDCAPPDPAGELLAALGVDVPAVRNRLRPAA